MSHYLQRLWYRSRRSNDICLIGFTGSSAHNKDDDHQYQAPHLCGHILSVYELSHSEGCNYTVEQKIGNNTHPPAQEKIVLIEVLLLVVLQLLHAIATRRIELSCNNE